MSQGKTSEPVTLTLMPRYLRSHSLIDPGCVINRHSYMLSLGQECDSRCSYCMNDGFTGWYPLEDLKRVITLAARLGLGVPVFTGGEPSIYPHLTQLMEHGRALGVTTFGMQTSGSGLTDPEYVRTLMALGLRRWHLSLDDHRDDEGLRRMGLKVPTEQTFALLESLHRGPEIFLQIKQTLTRLNYEAVPGLVSFAAGLRTRFGRVRQLVSGILKPSGRALRNERKLLFALDDALPFLTEAMELSRRLDFPYLIHHLPSCVIPAQRGRLVSTSLLERRLSIGRSDVELTWPDLNRGLRHRAACLRCVDFESCGGFNREYSRVHGDHLFQPAPSMERATPVSESALEGANPPEAGCEEALGISEQRIHEIAAAMPEIFEHPLQLEGQASGSDRARRSNPARDSVRKTLHEGKWPSPDLLAAAVHETISAARSQVKLDGAPERRSDQTLLLRFSSAAGALEVLLHPREGAHAARFYNVQCRFSSSTLDEADISEVRRGLATALDFRSRTAESFIDDVVAGRARGSGLAALVEDVLSRSGEVPAGLQGYSWWWPSQDLRGRAFVSFSRAGVWVDLCLEPRSTEGRAFKQTATVSLSHLGALPDDGGQTGRAIDWFVGALSQQEEGLGPP